MQCITGKCIKLTIVNSISGGGVINQSGLLVNHCPGYNGPTTQQFVLYICAFVFVYISVRLELYLYGIYLYGVYLFEL